MIFALDATEGNTSWPSGLALSLSASHARKVGLSVPDTPSLKEFQSQARLTSKASFFGCDNTEAPAIVYMPNHMVSYASNSSYSKLQWTGEEQHKMLQNGFDQLTEDDLPFCLSCLLSSRQKDVCESSSHPREEGRERVAWPIAMQDPCERCFSKYCWTPPEGHQLDSWETTSRAVDQVNQANFDGILASLLLSEDE